MPTMRLSLSVVNGRCQIARPNAILFVECPGVRETSHPSSAFYWSARAVPQRFSDAAIDSDPAWSPDGTKIAFSTSRDGNFEIYVMNADGTGPTRLTNDPANDRFAAWSPTR